MASLGALTSFRPIQGILQNLYKSRQEWLAHDADMLSTDVFHGDARSQPAPAQIRVKWAKQQPSAGANQEHGSGIRLRLIARVRGHIRLDHLEIGLGLVLGVDE